MGRRASPRPPRRSTGTATPTVPPPSCARPSPRSTASDPSRSSWPTAPTRSSRPSCSPTAARVARPRCSSPPTPCTPTSPASPAPRSCRGSGPPTSPSTSRGRVGSSTGSSPSVTFLCSPNNPTGLVDPEATVRATCSTSSRPPTASLVVDEAYGQFAPWSALELVADDRPLVVTRTFSKTWSMAAARLGYLVGPAWVVDRAARRSCCRTTSTPLKQAAGITRPAAIDAEMDARVARLVEERGRLVAAPRRAARRRVALGRQLRAVPARAPSPAPTMWQRLVERSVLVRNCSSWPRLDGCLRVTIGTAERGRRLPRRPRGDPDVSAEPTTDGRRSARVARATTETDIDVELDLDGDGAGRDRRTGLPFFDHMLDQLGRHGGFDLVVRATGRPRDRRPPHRRGRRHRARRGLRGEALGDKAGSVGSPRTGCPLDEALVEVALDLSGRPYLHYEVEFPRREDPRRPALRPAAGRGVLAGLRRRRRPSPCTSPRCAGTTPTTSSRPPSRAWPAPCATPCASRARACRPPRACCEPRGPPA